MAKPPAKKTSDPTPDIELVGSIDENSQAFDATLFGRETFRFSTDINGFLLLNAVRGGGEFIDLLDSLVLLPDDALTGEDGKPLTGRDLERARDIEKERFHRCLAEERNFSVERLARMVADITEIAGNEDDET